MSVQPVRHPEIAELEALVTAIQCGSIGAAARRLGVSQPALSKRLRQFEALCATTLLERSPRGVTATPAGARVASAALPILDQAAQVGTLLAELRGQSTPLRIAASPVVVETLLPELLGLAREAIAGLPIELTAANSTVVRRLVQAGSADLGIAAGRSGEDDPDSVISDDEVVVGLPPGHPWRERPSLQLADLVTVPLVLRDPRSHARSMLDAALAERGLRLQAPTVELGSTQAAVQAALQTGSPAVLSRIAHGTDGRLEVRRLDDFALQRQFVVLLGEHAGADAIRMRDALLEAAERSEQVVRVDAPGGRK